MEAAFMEQIMNTRPNNVDEGNLRAAQFFRGSVSTKMVASPAALRSLESVDVNSLKETDRSKYLCASALVCARTRSGLGVLSRYTASHPVVLYSRDFCD